MVIAFPKKARPAIPPARPLTPDEINLRVALMARAADLCAIPAISGRKQ